MSDPSHERYGAHLTSDEVTELIAPSETALAGVHSWLADHGVSAQQLEYSPASDWISVAMPVHKAEKLLDTSYSVYRHEDGAYAVRTPQWSLPQHLHAHVDAIQPTNSFMRLSPSRRTFKPVAPLGSFSDDMPGLPYVDSVADAPAVAMDMPSEVAVSAPAFSPHASQVCNTTSVTPLCLRVLYGTYGYEPQAAGRNRIGLTNYLGEFSNRTDVASFLRLYRPEAVDAAEQFEIEAVAGDTDPQTPDTDEQLMHGEGIEGNLDAETILGIAWPTPLKVFETRGSPPFTRDLHTLKNSNEVRRVLLCISFAHAPARGAPMKQYHAC